MSLALHTGLGRLCNSNRIFDNFKHLRTDFFPYKKEENGSNSINNVPFFSQLSKLPPRWVI